MQRLTKTITRFLALVLMAGVAAASEGANVNWLTDVEPALQKANESGQLVLLKFTADWCGYCKKMERETFTRPAVANLVNTRFVPVLVDADKYQPLVKHLKIKGLPAILVVSPDMAILERVSGYQTEDKLLPILTNTLAKHQSVKTQTQIVAASPGFTPPPTRPVSKQAYPDRTGPAKGDAANPFAPVTQSKRPAVFNKPAFGGLCLPGVNETRSLINGMPQNSMKYRGKILYFSSQEQMQKFTANPAKYWPMKDGTCPVTLAEAGRVQEGQLEYAAMFRGKLWFTSSPEQMKKFVATPARYVDAVQTR